MAIQRYPFFVHTARFFRRVVATVLPVWILEGGCHEETPAALLPATAGALCVHFDAPDIRARRPLLSAGGLIGHGIIHRLPDGRYTRGCERHEVVRSSEPRPSRPQLCKHALRVWPRLVSQFRGFFCTSA